MCLLNNNCKNQTFHLSGIDEALSNIVEESDCYIGSFKLVDYEGSKIELFYPIMKFTAGGTTLFYGAEFMCYQWDDAWMPDFAGTWLWYTEDDYEDLAYYEGDDIETTVRNFCNTMGIKADSLVVEVIDWGGEDE